MAEAARQKRGKGAQKRQCQARGTWDMILEASWRQQMQARRQPAANSANLSSAAHKCENQQES